MSTTIYALDVKAKTLVAVPSRPMSELGLSEPYDLETWLASAGGELFDRRVLWIARQDRPSDEQRSDLLGVDAAGDLLVTELKRGTLADDGVIQALAYAAEYAGKTADNLAEIFAEQSLKVSAMGLVKKASSVDNAQSLLSSHVGPTTEINESQILLLVAEDFSAKALAICDYLNSASGEATFSIECWRYKVYETAAAMHYFMLEQILPAPSVRDAIDEKREASKARKHARDPVRVEFMRGFMTYLQGKTVSASRSRGQSYECRLTHKTWKGNHGLWFSVHASRPRLIFGQDLRFDGDLATKQLAAATTWNGSPCLEFVDINADSATFQDVLGARVVGVVEALIEVAATDQVKAADAISDPGHKTA